MKRWTEEEEDRVEDAITFWLMVAALVISLICVGIMIAISIGG